MISPLAIIIIFCLYMGGFFLLARATESGNSCLKKISAHPLVYSLGLGIYCTTWTYYGSVGNAATLGMVFLAMYIGPTIGIFSWWFLLRKLVRIKHIYRITSIADFISARYSRSNFLAALVTIVSLIGLIPYVALQLRATISTMEMIILTPSIESGEIISQYMAWILIGLIVIFTIIFGARHLDPTESHRGMMLSVAIQSLVQLTAFLCVGIICTYGYFNGFGDIFNQFVQSDFSTVIQIGRDNPDRYLLWGTYLVLAMSAVMFLPRQFHVAVVENTDERHVATALWAFPLYMFLITLFTVPIAIAGLLKGLPIEDADKFVLQLPLMHKQGIVAIIVFFGGLSAAVSMIMISAMTVATMITNHLVLPLVHVFPVLDGLKRKLLKCRWIIIFFFIIISYLYERNLGESYMLVNIGLISFAAVLQFAPAMIGGLYWRKGNYIGATFGLSGGFIIWFYTLFFPALIKSGSGKFISVLENGPWGISLLKPENLLGIDLPNNMVHAVFWTMIINIGLYVLGSLCTTVKHEDQLYADEMIDILKTKGNGDFLVKTQMGTIDLQSKIILLEKVLLPYFKRPQMDAIVCRCLEFLKLEGKEKISIIDLAQIRSEMEKILTGYIGSSTAYNVVQSSNIFSSEEARELSHVYSEILADFELTPEELIGKIDYYKEREGMIKKHAQVLEGKMLEVKQSEKKYRTLVENINIGVYRATSDDVGRFLEVNAALVNMFGFLREDLLSMDIVDLYLDPGGRKIFNQKILEKGYVKNEELQFKHINGTALWVSVSAIVVEDKLLGIKFYDGIIEDVTERKLSQEALQKSKTDLEVRVESRTQALKYANQQLQEDLVTIRRKEIELKKAYTDLKEIQEQLFQSEKLASIGQLAAGVAHEINNPLTFVKSNLEVLKDDFEDLEQYLNRIYDAEKADLMRSDIEDLLKESLEGIDRIRKIVLDLKVMSRSDEGGLGFVDVHELLEKSLNVVSGETKYKADIIREFGDIEQIKCNDQRIIQVLINVLMNAVQSITQNGKIFIRTFEKEKFICIQIEDTGKGMSSDILQQIWDPFFTTKPVGEGTGLGLSISYDIMQSHNGFLEVESEEGKGSIFTLKFPIE